jgi:Family of unknown function (DUF5681)
MAKKSKSGVVVGDVDVQEATAAQTGAQPGNGKRQGKADGGASSAPGRMGKPKNCAADSAPEVAPKVSARLANLRPGWKPGQSGNPKGRPKGLRNKFSENYIDAMQRAFEERGVAAIHAVIDESPAEFLRLCSAIVPKQFGVEEGSQDVFLKLWQAISDGTAAV